jgi:hypothetical protein
MKEILSNERRALAYFWSIVIAIILAYAVINYGQDKAILNLIIGFLIGVAGNSLFGYYFGDSAKKTEPNPVVKETPIDKI